MAIIFIIVVTITTFIIDVFDGGISSIASWPLSTVSSSWRPVPKLLLMWMTPSSHSHGTSKPKWTGKWYDLGSLSLPEKEKGKWDQRRRAWMERGKFNK